MFLFGMFTPLFASSNFNSQSVVQYVPFLVLLAAAYFLIIRPQSKRAKEHTNMLSKLSVGDCVITSSGIVVIIKKISESQEVLVESVSGTKFVIIKNHITGIYSESSLQNKNYFENSLSDKIDEKSSKKDEMNLEKNSSSAFDESDLNDGSVNGDRKKKFSKGDKNVKNGEKKEI